jgi:hypothetical protein
MTLHPNKSRFSELRAFLIVAAVVSLCTSSNVGPRFLPLPEVIDPIQKESQGKGTAASHSRNSELESFRVPMMGQAQKRSDTESPPQPLGLIPGLGFVLANDVRGVTEFSHVSYLFISDSVSQPTGRAPPPVV